LCKAPKIIPMIKAASKPSRIESKKLGSIVLCPF
jgi:hypothetical protein